MTATSLPSPSGTEVKVSDLLDYTLSLMDHDLPETWQDVAGPQSKPENEYLRGIVEVLADTCVLSTGGPVFIETSTQAIFDALRARQEARA
jgi:hypothetical protein